MLPVKEQALPERRTWWPVAPSILAYLAMIIVPIYAVYVAGESGFPVVLAFFIVIIVLAFALTLLEVIVGAKTQGRVLTHTDMLSALFGFLFTGVIGNSIVTILLAPLSESVSTSLGTAFWPSSWPLLVQVAIGVAISDLVMYPIHRYMHKHDSLWRIHVVHHSVRELRPMRNFLQHPFEVILLGVVPAIPLIVLGAPTMTIILVGTVRAVVATVDHSSLPLRTGWLDYIIHTPNDHWWHHNLEDQGGTNFTTVVIPIDILFGTFKKPPTRDPVPVQTGIGAPAIEQNRYFNQLSVPFRWKSVERAGHS